MAVTAPRRTRALVALAALAAGSLLAGCGGGGDDNREAKTPAELAKDLEREEAKGGDDEGEDANQAEGVSGERVGTLTFLPPESADAPAGFATLENACDPDARYGAYIQYAVPEDWEVNGRGMGGTGRTLDGNIDHTFKTANGTVKVALSLDSRDDQNQILNGESEPSESFDYEYSVGDDVTQVQYAKAFQASAGGQDHQVWTVDEATYPGVIRGVEFRLRLEVVHMTWPVDGESTTSFSLQLTGSSEDLDEATVTSIVESLAIPECVRTSVTIQGELMTSADLDGDGKVSSGEDLQRDLAG